MPDNSSLANSVHTNSSRNQFNSLTESIPFVPLCHSFLVYAAQGYISNQVSKSLLVRTWPGKGVAANILHCLAQMSVTHPPFVIPCDSWQLRNR